MKKVNKILNKSADTDLSMLEKSMGKIDQDNSEYESESDGPTTIRHQIDLSQTLF